jgi:hypothetical protein
LNLTWIRFKKKKKVADINKAIYNEVELQNKFRIEEETFPECIGRFNKLKFLIMMKIVMGVVLL